MLQQHIFVTVDAVVLGKINDRLHIILVKRGHDPYKDMWALPGGFVEDDEDLEPAAIRELHEETNVKVEHMQQLYAVGTPGRDPRIRTVSIVHYTYIHPEEHNVKGGDDAKEAKWWNIDNLPPLAFDHADVIAYALNKLRQDEG